MNRLMIRHTMDKPLPYDAEVEYIESSGTQYIDTEVLGGNNIDINLDVNVINNNLDFIPFGYWGRDAWSNPNSCYIMDYNFSQNTFYFWKGYLVNHTPTSTLQLNINTNISYVGNTAKVKTSQSTVSVNFTSSIFTTPGNLFIFAANRGKEIRYSASFRLFACQIKQNGTLIRDYIPVRKGNTGYLYDKVSGRLFGNQGTGSFVVGPDYNPFAYQYLTFVPLEDSTFSFSKRGTGNDIEYSIDGGAWTSLASEANTPTVGAGHNIRWRAELTPSTASGSQGIGTFSASGLYDAMGNTMSLLYGDNYIGQTTLVGTHTFYALWRNDTHIYRADNLILPATTLTTYCYVQMYYGCTALTTAPELPATTLAAYCYQGMFQECTSLTTAPALPATTLANYCYYQMFYKCTGLTTAPELPATILKSQCYRLMFSYCSKLNYIKCLATDISASNCTYYWLSMVSPTGTFVKASGMTGWSTNVSGIPSGWTVVDDPSTISNS